VSTRPERALLGRRREIGKLYKLSRRETVVLPDFLQQPSLQGGGGRVGDQGPHPHRFSFVVVAKLSFGHCPAVQWEGPDGLATHGRRAGHMRDLTGVNRAWFLGSVKNRPRAFARIGTAGWAWSAAPRRLRRG
jgi:hypothetical protein